MPLDFGFVPSLGDNLGNDVMDDGFEVLIFITAAAAIGMIAGGSFTRADFKIQAIEHGYAQYCPANGAWAWKGECRE